MIEGTTASPVEGRRGRRPGKGGGLAAGSDQQTCRREGKGDECGIEHDHPPDLAFHYLGDLAAKLGAEHAEVVLGGDVLPGGGRQVGHEGVGFLVSEQAAERKSALISQVVTGEFSVLGAA